MGAWENSTPLARPPPSTVISVRQHRSWRRRGRIRNYGMRSVLCGSRDWSCATRHTCRDFKSKLGARLGRKHTQATERARVRQKGFGYASHHGESDLSKQRGRGKVIPDGTTYTKCISFPQTIFVPHELHGASMRSSGSPDTATQSFCAALSSIVCLNTSNECSMRGGVHGNDPERSHSLCRWGWITT